MLILSARWFDLISPLWGGGEGGNYVNMMKYFQISQRRIARSAETPALLFSPVTGESGDGQAVQPWCTEWLTLSPGPGHQIRSYARSSREQYWQSSDALNTQHHPPVGKTFLTTTLDWPRAVTVTVCPCLLSLRRYLPLQWPLTNHHDRQSSVVCWEGNKYSLCPWSLLSIIFISKIPVYKR